MKDNNIRYNAFIVSAKLEIANIERIFNALLLSRTGFVFQEIKDLEFEVMYEIQDRSMQVNNTDCIFLANRQLQDASADAGSGSIMAYQDIMQRVEFMRYVLVYPVLFELTRVIPQFTVDPFNLLGYFNPVTNFDLVMSTLLRELNTFDELFEAFVDEVIIEMNSFDRYNREMFMTLHQSLEASRQGFFNSVNDIRSFLLTC